MAARPKQPPPPPPPARSADSRFQSILSAYISANKARDNTAPLKDQGEGPLTTVAKSLRKCVSGMSSWGISDLTLGLYKIAAQHALDGVSDTIHGSEVSDKQELEEISYWLDWAQASYLDDKEAIIKFMNIEKQQLKKHVDRSAPLKPAYCIAVDHAKKCVVLCIRGTYAATDVLTDLQPHSEKFEAGYAHSGILSAARWILNSETANIKILLSENKGYRLVLAGHSLGAGVASLLSFLYRDSVDSGRSSRLGISSSLIQCWGFGCPPCVDRQLSERAPFIYNIVLQDDMVARASVAAFEDLRTEILQTEWGDALEDGGTAKKMLGLVNNTNSTLTYVEQALGYESGTLYQQAKSWGYATTVKLCTATVTRARQGLPGYNGPTTQEGPPGPQPYDMQLPQRQNFFPLVASGISSYWSTPGEPNQMQGNIGSEFMERGRLFVPGVLYHVKRSWLESSSSSASIARDRMPGLTTETNRLNSAEDIDTGAITRVNKEGSRSKAVAGRRHNIVKGFDPKSRFMKIVLSKSLLTDHSLASYKMAIEDVIHGSVGL